MHLDWSQYAGTSTQLLCNLKFESTCILASIKVHCGICADRLFCRNYQFIVNGFSLVGLLMLAIIITFAQKGDRLITIWRSKFNTECLGLLYQYSILQYFFQLIPNAMFKTLIKHFSSLMCQNYI